jgi:hypothetical protein
MTQYKIVFKNTSTPPQCGTGDLTIQLVDGVPEVSGNTIKQIFVYYASTDSGEYQVTCEDGPIDDHIVLAYVATTQATDGSWPSSGGCRWERNVTGHLVLKFTPPEAACVGAKQTWSFDPTTPPVQLKITIKRQTGANSGSCTTWADP